jgi:hypothetical protein
MNQAKKELFYISQSVAENNEGSPENLEHLTINKGFGYGEAFESRQDAKIWLIEDLENAAECAKTSIEEEGKYLKRINVKLEQLRNK